jgi:pantetheine-phosphate adenylyltransferase
MSTNPIKSRVGIYVGSFSPFHIGHLDIVRQSQKVFDDVYVVQAINPDKAMPAIPLPVTFLLEMNVISATHSGLVTDYIKKWEGDGYNVTLIRGLRSGADLGYEQNLVAFLRNMHPEIKVVFFLCDPKFQHVSSSALRGIRQFSEAEYRKYAVG